MHQHVLIGLQQTVEPGTYQAVHQTLARLLLRADQHHELQL
jgi:hypothetical protein